MILKILGLLFIFHTLLFADTSLIEENRQISSSTIEQAKSKDQVATSFSSQSIVYMMVLTSLLGIFFLKDDLSDSI